MRSIASSLLLGLLAAIPASAQVAFDAATLAEQTGNQATLTWSHTSTGSNLALVVGCSWYDNTVGAGGDELTGVTYNGVSMTASTSTIESGSDDRVRMFHLAGPATGANDVVATWDAAQQYVICGSVTFTGVDQTTPVSGCDTASGNDDPFTITITSATNSMVIDTVAYQGNNTRTPGTGQTTRWEEDDSGQDGMGSTEAGAASVEMSWTLGGGAPDWAQAACSVDPVAAAGLPPGGLLRLGVGR